MLVAILVAKRRNSYPAGRQPYDTMKGAQVGALTGGVLAMIPLALNVPGGFLLVVGGALLGGGIGFLWERRQLQAAEERDPVD